MTCELLPVVKEGEKVAFLFEFVSEVRPALFEASLLLFDSGGTWEGEFAVVSAVAWRWSRLLVEGNVAALRLTIGRSDERLTTEDWAAARRGAP